MSHTICNYICRPLCLLHIQFSLYENYTVLLKICQYMFLKFIGIFS